MSRECNQSEEKTMSTEMKTIGRTIAKGKVDENKKVECNQSEKETQ